MRRQRKALIQESKINLTAMIDMLSVILIFLLVCFAFQKSGGLRAVHVTLPTTTEAIQTIDRHTVTLTANQLLLDDQIVAEFKTSPAEISQETWSSLKAKIAQSQKPTSLLADRLTPTGFIDQVLFHMPNASIELIGKSKEAP